MTGNATEVSESYLCILMTAVCRSAAGTRRCVFLFLVAISSAAAQVGQYEGRTIVAIQYEPAQQPLTSRDLANAQTLKTGQPLRQADVSAAIDSLFATGRYDDIRVDVQPSGNGVAVRFLTKDKYFVGHIETQGKVKEPPHRGQIDDASQLNLGDPFVEKDVTTADANISNLLQRNGFYEGTVTHRLEPSDTAQQMNIVFDIEEGRRARFTTPVISGDPKLSANDIIKASHWRRLLIGGWKTITESRVQSGVMGIHNRYQKKDRLMAKVELTSLKYDPGTRTAVPALNIDAGPVVKIRAVEAKVSKSRLRKYVPIYQEGSVDRDLLVEGARNLRDYFQSQGYYEAEIDFREHPVPGKDETDIDYVIAKGQRHKLVHIAIEGNKYFTTGELKDRLILHVASFPQFRHGRYSEAYRSD